MYNARLRNFGRHYRKIGRKIIALLLVLYIVLMPGETGLTFVTKLEEYNLRVFHREINHIVAWCCTEIALMQVSWYAWDEAKHLWPKLV